MTTKDESYVELLGTAASIKEAAGAGTLDLGYAIGGMSMATPTRSSAANAGTIARTNKFGVVVVRVAAVDIYVRHLQTGPRGCLEPDFYR